MLSVPEPKNGRQGHPRYQGWPCPPSLHSGTLIVLLVPPFLTPHSWHTSNKYINIQILGYLPWGKIRSSMTSGITMSSISMVRNPNVLQVPPFLVRLVRICSFGEEWNVNCLCVQPIWRTTISGPYGPFILAPAEGWWVGHQPISWTFSLSLQPLAQ